MKITKSYLKQIIKEELQNMDEAGRGASSRFSAIDQSGEPTGDPNLEPNTYVPGPADTGDAERAKLRSELLKMFDNIVNTGTDQQIAKLIKDLGYDDAYAPDRRSLKNSPMYVQKFLAKGMKK